MGAALPVPRHCAPLLDADIPRVGFGSSRLPSSVILFRSNSVLLIPQSRRFTSSILPYPLPSAVSAIGFDIVIS